MNQSLDKASAIPGGVTGAENQPCGYRRLKDTQNLKCEDRRLENCVVLKTED